MGSLVGFLGGFLGIGGGAVMMHLSLGTSLAIIIPASIAGSWAQTRIGNVGWRMVCLMAIPGIVGSFLGSTIAAHLPSQVLRPLFGILLILISAQMLLQKKTAGEAGESLPPRVSAVLLVGAAVGLAPGELAADEAPWVAVAAAVNRGEHLTSSGP